MKFAGIDFHDLAIGLYAALIIMIMPFTWSITNGIGFGFIAYVLVRIGQGEARASVHVRVGSGVRPVLPVRLLQDHLSWI